MKEGKVQRSEVRGSPFRVQRFGVNGEPGTGNGQIIILLIFLIDLALLIFYSVALFMDAGNNG